MTEVIPMASGNPIIRQRIQVTGVVQGVGFRPFVYATAMRLGVRGFVANTSMGVLIEAEGSPEAIDGLREALRNDPPPLAHIDTIEATEMAPVEDTAFAIHHSHATAGENTPVPPDIAICADCLREMFDPADRRYLYPFINCTNCGPRFTILRELPYDRPLTTMSVFPMCPACEAEYNDPLNRRFHAQPISCPDCGPRLFLKPGALEGRPALLEAKRLLRTGAIVAIKGIGGFHLACDATSDKAVLELRRRKGRAGKPFAVMARSLADVQRYAKVSEDEVRILNSSEKPIVLLDRKPDAEPLSQHVAPGQTQLGFVLPYSPLHALLLDEVPLVMTSGNRSDEPIARENNEAFERLAGLADAFLCHDREIHVVCDDSVVRVFAGREMPIRRSRGYAPLPVPLPVASPALLGAGGELKATFCLARGRRAYMSQHIGDMENLETQAAYERSLEQMRRLFRIQPEVVACDLHPGYLSSLWAKRFAEENRLPLVRVQHHHAHAASLMAEHGMNADDRMIAVAFDGTGLGTDDAIWGGEFLLASYRSFERLGHLRYVRLPGGD
ncbi:MAG TPA: carbamoyltransferase HypF, partial [Edaphobacter sp.]